MNQAWGISLFLHILIGIGFSLPGREPFNLKGYVEKSYLQRNTHINSISVEYLAPKNKIRSIKTENHLPKRTHQDFKQKQSSLFPSKKIQSEIHSDHKTLTASLSEESTLQNLSGEEMGIQAIYPRLSRRLGERGKVLIELRRNTEGALVAPMVVLSSGFSRLDKSAIQAIQEALLSGRLEKFLLNQEYLRVSFTFQLTPSKALK